MHSHQTVKKARCRVPNAESCDLTGVPGFESMGKSLMTYRCINNYFKEVREHRRECKIHVSVFAHTHNG